MINYLNAENYRFQRSKKFHITNLVVLLALIAGAIGIYVISTRVDLESLATVFFRTTLNMMVFIIFINLIYVGILTNKDLKTLPLAIANGVSRKEIFFSKLTVLLSHIVVTEIVFMAVAVLLSRLVYGVYDPKVTKDFIVGYINLFPIIISAFIMCYAIAINGISEVYNSMLIFAIYGGLLKFAFYLGTALIGPIMQYYKYTPSGVYELTLQYFDAGTMSIIPHSFVVGIIISALSIIIGYNVFKKKQF